VRGPADAYGVQTMRAVENFAISVCARRGSSPRDTRQKAAAEANARRRLDLTSRAHHRR
jgi:aspartate ammonia-lyase